MAFSIFQNSFSFFPPTETATVVHKNMRKRAGRVRLQNRLAEKELPGVEPEVAVSTLDGYPSLTALLVFRWVLQYINVARGYQLHRYPLYRSACLNTPMVDVFLLLACCSIGRSCFSQAFLSLSLFFVEVRALSRRTPVVCLP